MRQIADNRELVQFILSAERHLLRKFDDVTDLLPVVRMFLYFSLARNRKVVRSEEPPKEHALERVYWLIRRCRDFLDFLLFAHAKSIIVAPSVHRNIPDEPFFRSKHLDALITAMSSETFYAIESEAKINGRSKYRDPCSLVQGFARLANLVCRCPTELKLIAKEVCSYTSELIEDISLDEKRLLHELREYETSSKLYSFIFKLKGIKKGCFIVYYLTPHLAMIRALNSLSGQSVEYQHGIQNDYQPMYTHWAHLALSPQCLPKSIWVWDEVSKKRIEQWAVPLGIEAINKGNFWLEQLNIDMETKNKSSSVILVALQKFPEHFNYGILDAVKEFPNLSWVFREHPSWPVPEDSRRELLSKFGNISFQKGKERSLEEALSECDICITGFSTVGVEALSFGVSTLFTHVNALNGLSSYIDNEHCFYAGNAEDILSVIQSLDIQ